MLLARRGYRVLLVDRASFPSDMLSTHLIWPRGVEALERWGLAERLRDAGTPTIALDYLIDFGTIAITGTDSGNRGKGGLCPRRIILDQMVVNAAIESGAEVRERFTIDELTWDGDRVTGIRGHSADGKTVEEQARIVIGADGVYSTIAKLVEAPEYNVVPPLITFYYSYFSGFRIEDGETHMRDYEMLVCFPTNDGLTMISGAWPSSRFPEIRADIEGNFAKLVATVPSAAERLQTARREEKWYGTAGVPNYFRKPYGPGWALVGDAAYDKDPISAQGISDAFIEAEHLADALDQVLSGSAPEEETLSAYEKSRNQRAQELYAFTCQNGTLAPQPAALMQVLEATQNNREASDLLISAVGGSVPVSAFITRKTSRASSVPRPLTDSFTQNNYRALRKTPRTPLA